MGRIIIVVGVVLIFIGLVLHYFPTLFSGFGRFPGDIRIQKPGYSFYMPITSMLLLSALISLLFWLYNRFF